MTGIIVPEHVLLCLVKLAIRAVLVAVPNHIPGTKNELREIVQVDPGNRKPTRPFAALEIMHVVLQDLGAALLPAKGVNRPAVVVKEHAAVNIVVPNLVVAATAIDVATGLLAYLDSGIRHIVDLVVIDSQAPDKSRQNSSATRVGLAGTVDPVVPDGHSGALLSRWRVAP